MTYDPSKVYVTNNTFVSVCCGKETEPVLLFVEDRATEKPLDGDHQTFPSKDAAYAFCFERGYIKEYTRNA